MTHSWGVSDHNPTQKHAAPERFECQPKTHPSVPFAFGHIGGHPNGFPAAVEMIKKYPQCMDDLSGDLLFNGYVRHAMSETGPDRLLFATDMYWIDPRCVMGMLLEIKELSNEDLLKILRRHAEQFYPSKL